MRNNSGRDANGPESHLQAGATSETIGRSNLTSSVASPPTRPQSPGGRMLPDIDGGTPKGAPGVYAFDTRSGVLSTERSPDRRNRPLGRRIPKPGNISQRAVRRAMERAEREGRRAYHAEGARLVAAFAAAARAEGGTA